ncbi:VWA domain-containing protein [Halieaceae bacterium IMCC14734]|uniref:VWA domain-containing protein n=1 Tax=Candidatus Litorirhabdus singularis TaxID=2518993 RepID=A0ABT3TGK0_9GAMM|nr:VWA domain-containing protein [Candidatus Litorirhabdus singularis]MCX2981443.1 VWA domain-containing protein [Candidatus Litorirhabdus singularis]
MSALRSWLVVLLVLGAGSMLSPPLVASERLPDVRLLIDISGSMRESDPDNLRAPALELMVRLLPDGSRAGVWTFGEHVNMPVPHALVDEPWRERASAAVAEIGNHGLLTNIPEALRAATWDAARLHYDYQTSVILLTDGKVEVSADGAENAAAAQLLLEQTAREFREAGITVHTIALSAEADETFLTQLAQATGGLSERVVSAEQLSAVFLQALDIAAPTEQVPLFGGEFLIDASVSEFTALIFHDPNVDEVGLAGPDGQQYNAGSDNPAVGWFQHPRFQLITVSEPAAGAWLISAPSAIARVNVLSKLSLEIDAPPTTMPEGRIPEIGISLTEAGRAVTDAELLGLLSLSIQVERQDGERWQLQASGADVDGAGEVRLPLTMLAAAGRYQIQVQADGGSYQREVNLITDVYAPPPELEAPPESVDTGWVPAGWLPPAIVSLLLLVLVAVFMWPRRRR